MTRDVGDVFGALADPTRRSVLDAVAARGPVSATELAAELPVSRQAIVKHLRVLDDAGLVTGQRHGRHHRYEAVPATLHDVRAWVDATAARWDRRLARLRYHLDEDTRTSPPSRG